MEYFPEEFQVKIESIFGLFAVKNPGYCDFEELKNILTCTNSCYDSEEELYSIYKLLERPGQGINESELKIILTKKMKDNDKKSDILEAFSFLPIDEDYKIDTETFFDLLMEKGYKYTSEQAAVVIKEADPKNTGKIDVRLFVDNILQTEKKKPKKKGGSKKI